MPGFVSKDYHIELMSLFEYANDCLSNGTIAAKAGQQLQAIFKRAVLGAEIKPFMALSDKSSDPNSYEKYYQLANEINGPMLSGVFEENGDLYDLMTTLNISKEHISFQDFKMLFLLKVSEIENRKHLHLEEFLHFQLFDNFFGDPQTFDSFCCHLTANDGFCPLSAFSIKTLVTWCDTYTKNIDINTVTHQEINEDKDLLTTIPIDTINNHSIEKKITTFITNHKKDDESIFDKNDDVASFDVKEPFEIKGRFTIEQIRHYFSFLYKERSRDKKPFLEEEYVEVMFKNGLVIPVEPLDKKFKLNYDVRFPKRIVDHAIHFFFTNNSFTQRDKAYYFQFFGSYIEDYSKALGTKDDLKYLTSNISGERSPRAKFKIENYLPK